MHPNRLRAQAAENENTDAMRIEGLETFVQELAARVPAPGGGASAGPHAAQAAVTDLVAGLPPVPGGAGPVTTALWPRQPVESASRSAM
ncbi:hypothetical protein ACWDKQ_11645 [Saccharopolyspora sp. NPDC000995]